MNTQHGRHTPPRSASTDSSTHSVALMQISADVILIFSVCLSSTEICIKLHTREPCEAVMLLKGRKTKWGRKSVSANKHQSINVTWKLIIMPEAHENCQQWEKIQIMHTIKIHSFLHRDNYVTLHQINVNLGGKYYPKKNFLVILLILTDIFLHAIHAGKATHSVWVMSVCCHVLWHHKLKSQNASPVLYMLCLKAFTGDTS